MHYYTFTSLLFILCKRYLYNLLCKFIIRYTYCCCLLRNKACVSHSWKCINLKTEYIIILIKKFINSCVCCYACCLAAFFCPEPLEGFYDYKNKYKAGSTKETCPANIPEDIASQMQFWAEKCCLVSFFS